MDWLQELSAEENEWARALVSVIIGAILGAGASLIVQALSNRAAKARQRQAELAKHCDKLIQLLRAAKLPKNGFAIDGTKYRYIPVDDWEIQYRQETSRTLMWLPRPGLLKRIMKPTQWNQADTSHEDAFREINETLKDEHMTFHEMDPDFFRTEDGQKYRKSVAEAWFKYRESVVDGLIKLPSTKPSDVYSELQAAQTTFMQRVSSAWEKCEPLLCEERRAQRERWDQEGLLEWEPNDKVLDLLDEVKREAEEATSLDDRPDPSEK